MAVVGVVQSTFSVLAIIFAFILYFNFFDVQNTLGIPSSDVALYTMSILMLGFLLIITGMFLIYEWHCF